MPDLNYCLRGHDPGFLKILIELWGLELKYSDPETMRREIQAAITNKVLFQEVVSALPQNAQSALQLISFQNGVLPWSSFINKVGILRDIGPFQRDREKIFRKPISSTEILWYHALIGREFLEYEGSIIECVYIPDEFKEWIPGIPQPTNVQALKGIEETKHLFLSKANDEILNVSCTVLAALRRPDSAKLLQNISSQIPIETIQSLMSSIKLIGHDRLPNADNARPFLEMERAKALLFLVEGWKASQKFNEALLTPSLIFEGKNAIDPIGIRKKIIKIIETLADNEWYGIDEFIHWIHEFSPDFLRQAGDYDHWLIRSRITNEPLKGFTYWFEVEGEIIRYFLTGPMHWLGLVDLASTTENDQASFFQKSAWFDALCRGLTPQGLLQENDPVVISSSGLIFMTELTPRIARYQVSRFGEWDQSPKSGFVYRLSPQALTVAADQGLTPAHLISLLRKYGKNPPPPSLVKAIKRWQEAGNEASIESLYVLRVTSPEILKQLRESSAGHYLGDPLGPVSVVVKKEGLKKVRAALTRMGCLADIVDVP